ncbi:MAG: polysaccharide biosynthesis/export family protein [Rhodobacterales bacterium]
MNISRLPLSLFKTFVFIFSLAACSLPRGAALQSEILTKSETASPDLAVYRVTKSFLPVVANWPKTGARIRHNWPRHNHGPNTPLIAAGDSVKLAIWDNQKNSLLTAPEQKVIQIDNVQVSQQGAIFVPYLGQIKIAGLSTEAARLKIKTKLETISPSAQLQLTGTQGSKRSVSLIGGAAAPGPYPVSDPHFSVLNLISEAGGASPGLRNPQVKLIRKGQTYSTSLDRIISTPSMDTVLRGGDKIIIENDPRYFRSLGAAAKEQIINFETDNISALDAMSLIGGLSDTRANPKGILILRQYPERAVRKDNSGPPNARAVFVIDLTSSDGLFSAGRFAVNSQDTVLVTEAPLTAVNTVFGVIGSIFGIASQANSVK